MTTSWKHLLAIGVPLAALACGGTDDARHLRVELDYAMLDCAKPAADKPVHLTGTGILVKAGDAKAGDVARSSDQSVLYAEVPTPDGALAMIEIAYGGNRAESVRYREVGNARLTFRGRPTQIALDMPQVDAAFSRPGHFAFAARNQDPAGSDGECARAISRGRVIPLDDGAYRETADEERTHGRQWRSHGDVWIHVESTRPYYDYPYGGCGGTEYPAPEPPPTSIYVPPSEPSPMPTPSGTEPPGPPSPPPTPNPTPSPGPAVDPPPPPPPISPTPATEIPPSSSTSSGEGGGCEGDTTSSSSSSSSSGSGCDSSSSSSSSSDSSSGCGGSSSKSSSSSCEGDSAAAHQARSGGIGSVPYAARSSVGFLWPIALGLGVNRRRRAASAKTNAPPPSPTASRETPASCDRRTATDSPPPSAQD